MQRFGVDRFSKVKNNPKKTETIIISHYLFMEKLKLHEVVTSGDVRHFLELPLRINAGNRNYVQPLRNDVENVFDRTKNELFHDGDAIRWILKNESGEVIGRIAAFYNQDIANANEQPTGGCGFFECVNDTQVATMLFDAACNWLKNKGMEAMDGPINFGDRNTWWGVLVEDFSMPLYGMNYNPPYYKELFETYGFQNYYNQHTYFKSVKIGELNTSTYERVSKFDDNPSYVFKSIEKKNLSKYADDFMEVYNRAWAKFNGVNPIDHDHAQALMKTLKPIINENLIYFAYHDGEPIGFFVMVPDINKIIYRFKGKFGLWQKLELIFRLKFTKQPDRILGLIFGVVPEFQGKAIESGMIYAFEKYILTNKMQYKTMEMNWVGDFNPVMMRMVENYVVATKSKRHVTYRYLFDREKPFTRAPRMGRDRKVKTTTETDA